MPKNVRKQPAYFNTDGVSPLFSTESMLILGDNLDTLPIWVGSESVDLIYLDPPFNSDKSYNAIFKHVDGTPAAAQIKAFDDTWEWNEAAREAFEGVLTSGGELSRVMHAFWEMLGASNMLAYLSMVAPRLVQLHRVLKPTGSIYLHCDPKASHYLKVLMDAVFGVSNFQNEFIWYYSGGGASKQRWARKHDIILFYSKTDEWVFNADAVRTPYKWDRGQKRADGSGRDLKKGKLADDVWEHHSLMPWAAERIGYPTQKPMALLERLISASSNPGDVVLDPFCGCGTAVDAAQKLGRRWIGIDISRLATDVIEARLNKNYPGLPYTFRVFPPTIEEAHRLAQQDRHAFQEWACFRIGASPSGKGADRGIDGSIDGFVKGQPWRALVSVKSGQSVKVSELRDLLGTVQREQAQSGIFLTLAKPPRTFAADVAQAGLGDMRIPRLQVLTIEQLLSGKTPVVPAPHGVAQFDADTTQQKRVSKIRKTTQQAR